MTTTLANLQENNAGLVKQIAAKTAMWCDEVKDHWSQRETERENGKESAGDDLYCSLVISCMQRENQYDHGWLQSQRLDALQPVTTGKIMLTLSPWWLEQWRWHSHWNRRLLEVSTSHVKKRIISTVPAVIDKPARQVLTCVSIMMVSISLKLTLSASYRTRMERNTRRRKDTSSTDSSL